LRKFQRQLVFLTVGTTTVTAIIRGCINALSDSCQTIGLATVCTCSTGEIVCLCSTGNLEKAHACL